MIKFTAKLFTYEGKGGWTFVLVPKKFGPRFVGHWGRVSVNIIVNGMSKSTSVWRAKEGECYLPIAKALRVNKKDGDQIEVLLEYLHD